MASNPFKAWGQTQITVAGQLLNTEPKPTFEPGGTTRKEVEGDNKAGYFSAQQKPSKLECSVIITPGVSVTWLQSLENVTIQVVLDTGQTWIMPGAWTAEAVNASDSKAKVTFMGQPAIEELS